MAFDVVKGPVGKGLLLGITAVVLAPIILPVVTRAARPLASAAVKTGMILYERGREAVAEAKEVFEDVVAEVRAELAQSEVQEDITTVETEAAAEGSQAPAQDVQTISPSA